VSWWRQLSGAQRAAVVTFGAMFVPFAVSALMQDGKSERRDIWHVITTVLLVALPALAIGLAWWIGEVTAGAPPWANLTTPRRRFRQRFAVVLFLVFQGVYWLIRLVHVDTGDWLDITLFVSWMVALVLFALSSRDWGWSAIE
jgi:hypothetical protein